MKYFLVYFLSLQTIYIPKLAASFNFQRAEYKRERKYFALYIDRRGVQFKRQIS